MKKTPRNQVANNAPDVLVPCEATQAHTQSGGGFARRWRPEEAWIMRGGLWGTSAQGLMGKLLGKGGAEPVRHRAALRQAANQALPARLPSQSGTPLPACNHGITCHHHSFALSNIESFKTRPIETTDFTITDLLVYRTGTGRQADDGLRHLRSELGDINTQTCQRPQLSTAATTSSALPHDRLCPEGGN